MKIDLTKKVKKAISIFLLSTMVMTNTLTTFAESTDFSSVKLNDDLTPKTGNKDEDISTTAKIYVNDRPIRLEVKKLKTKLGEHEGKNPKISNNLKENTITYEFSGRVNGSKSDLLQKYGNDKIELAYTDTGAYLGYGWLRGTKEYLEYREKNKDQFGDLSVELIKNEYGVFSGYAYITKQLDTTDNKNRYVAGAKLSLFDAIEVEKNYKKNLDDRFKGVTVKRNANGDVESIYVEKGYAGEKVDFVMEKRNPEKLSTDNSGIERNDNYAYSDTVNDKDKENGTAPIWTAKIVQREDTPVLFYSLNNLQITSNDTYLSNAVSNNDKIDEVFGNERPDKANSLYGFNKKREITNITKKDQTDFSIFAFEEGEINPSFEFVGGDFSKIKYNAISKTITMDDKTIMYHLDENGNRDALVDPYTGLAYIKEIDKNNKEHYYVWTVNIDKDGSGNTGTGLGNGNGSKKMRKIVTNRIATINADTKDEYTVGTYSEEKDANGNIVSKQFSHSQNPIVDENGMPIYYQHSNETYVKGKDIYDRDGDYLGYIYSDNLDSENKNSYTIGNENYVYDGNSANSFNSTNGYQFSTKQKIKITISDNNTPNDYSDDYVVNGKTTIPTPVRHDNRNLTGWMFVADNLINLKENDELNAKWSISNMTSSDKNKWYSDRNAIGNTKTINVYFNANGGIFENGNGAIHSSDNKIYRRQGDTYIMENTWISGETTPNDPFDKQFARTINHTNVTGNDPYSDTELGGMADMLKRVPVGKYILEEIGTPDGYVKSLPVGITVSETDDVQSAEMIDKTIKTQFIKLDDTVSDYVYFEYKNGSNELSKDKANQNITYKEPTNSFRFKNVKNAVMALKSVNNEELFKKWIAATNNPFITKSDDGKYITFNTTNPLYLEGIPKGKYILEEVTVPNGYVRAKNKTIEIKETEDLQNFIVNDDHTKLEIRKFTNNGNGKENLPDNNKATLELTDSDGRIIETWKTDSLSDYISNDNSNGFIDSFEKSMKAHGKFTNISWKVLRTAEKKTDENDNEEHWFVNDGSEVVIRNGNIPNEVSDGFRNAYRTRNLVTEQNKFTWEETMSAVISNSELNTSNTKLLKTNTGKYILATAIKSNDTENGKQSYKFEYKFNVRENFNNLGEKYENMISYDTVQGTHRFDYIPVGDYTLSETNVPRGFVKASDITIKVKETEAIQKYEMENKERIITVIKQAVGDNGEIFKTIKDNVEIYDEDSQLILAGAKFKLYKVDFITDEVKEKLMNGEDVVNATLVESWESGKDGVYTSTDDEKDLIPYGAKIGDFKPHLLKNLTNGNYIIVETKTPDYFKTMKPVSFTLTDKTVASDITQKLQNKENIGKIIVYKKNKQGSPLSNAIFKVTNVDTGEEVGTFKTIAGKGEMNIPNIGYFDLKGNLKPYRFSIKEVNPPQGYALDNSIYEFSFNKDNHGDFAYAYGIGNDKFKNGILTIENEVSEITLSKIDFKTLDGTKRNLNLVIKETEFVNGKWKIKDSGFEKNIEFTKDNYSKSIKGLVGGKTYAITEPTAPKNYSRAKNIYFRVSDDAKSIAKIWYDETENNVVDFEVNNNGIIEKLKLNQDMNFTTTAKLYKLNGGIKTFVKEIYNSVNGIDLATTELEKNQVYVIDVILNGTNEQVLKSYIFSNTNENEDRIHINTEYPKSSVVYITDGNDNVISDDNGEFKFTEMPITITNKMLSDSQNIKVIGNGEYHSAIYPKNGKNIVLYSVNVEKKGSVVTWKPDSNTTVRSTELNPEDINGTYKWITTKDNQVIKFSAILNNNAKTGFVNQVVNINGNAYSYLNPIAENTGKNLYVNTSKFIINNEVKGTNETNTSYNFTVKVKITDKDGNPLKGEYSYKTKTITNGVFSALQANTEFEVTLTGNDYVMVENLPYGAKYEVKLKDESDYGFQSNKKVITGNTNEKTIASDTFISTRNKTDRRETFKKNETYRIKKYIVLQNNEEMNVETYGFSLGEDGKVMSLEMLDKKVKLNIQKLNMNGEIIPNTGLLLRDEDGNEDEFVTDKNIFVKENGVVNVDKNLTLIEKKPADGYTFARPIEFRLTNDSFENTITMFDKETEVNVMKTDFDTGEIVSGAKLAILDENGNILKARKDTNIPSVEHPNENIKKGEDLVFKSTSTMLTLKGLLNVNTNYFLRELEAPNGYHRSKQDLLFRIYGDGELDTVLEFVSVNFDKVKGQDLNTLYPVPDLFEQELVEIPETLVLNMKDKQTDVRFRKTDFTTSKELPGARIILKDKSGNIIDSWTSSEDEHIIRGKLIGGEEYTMIEDGSPAGYHYTEEIKFTVPKDDDGNENLVVNKVDKLTGKLVEGAKLVIKNENDEIVDEWNTPKDDIYSIEYLPDGRYTLTEINIPEGYEKADDIAFEIKNGRIIQRDKSGKIIKSKLNSKQISDVITMEDNRKFVEISKTDAVTGREVKGATITIKKEDGTIVKTFTTDGVNPNKVRLEDGKYTLEETFVPNGYQKAEIVKFEVKNGTVSGNGKVVMKDLPSRTVGISKQDLVSGKEISGARLRITKENGTLIEEWISKANETHVIKNLEKGKYILTEELAPNGYNKASNITFEVNENGETNGMVVMKDELKSVVVSKQSMSGREIEGAKLKLVNEAGEVVASWTSINGKSTEISDLPNGTYRLVEETAPNGYLKANDMTFEVKNGKTEIGLITMYDKQMPYHRETIRVEMKDKPTKQEFKKTSFATSEELAGATLVVKDRTGYIVDKWVSDGTPHTIQGKLNAEETYTLEELYAPDGYYLANSINFTIPKIGEDIQKIEMKDEVIDLRIKKTDVATGSEVVGAKLTIKDKETGNVVESWVSNGSEHIIQGNNKLIAGKTYILEETTAPNGYYYTENIEFTIPKKNEGIVRLTMEDKQTEYDFTKTDAVSGKEIEGAKLKLTDSNGNVIDKWISTKTPHRISGKLISGNKYYLHEEMSPNGYYYENDIEFTVPRKGENVEKINMKDEPIEVHFKKTDLTNGTELKGAKLKVTDMDGNVIDEWVSDGKDHIITGKLESGKQYKMIETASPNGYFYAEDIIFTIPKYKGSVPVIEMKDKPTEMYFKKTDLTTGRELSGAKIRIEDSKGNVIDEWISSEEDHIVRGKLNSNETYTMIEEIAPNGYAIADKIKFTVPSDDKDVSKLKIEMKDELTNVEFIKMDLVSGSELKDTKLEIVDENDNKIAEWISGNGKKSLVGILNSNTIYKMREVTTPIGYDYAKDIIFRVGERGKVQFYDEMNKEWKEQNTNLITMYDDILKIDIQKIDSVTGRMIADAKLEIKDQNGKVVESWTTEENKAKEIRQKFSDGTYLNVGDVYTLSEIEVPNGYQKADDIKFQIKRNQNIQIITMKDNPNTVPKPYEKMKIKFNKIGHEISKSTGEIIKSEKVKGAKYEIRDINGNLYKTIESNGNGTDEFIIPDDGTYTVKEIENPIGYLLDKNTYSFTVKNGMLMSENKNISIDEILVEDYKKPNIKIYKMDSKTKEKLSGAVFEILDENGDVVYTGTTENSGYFIFEPNVAGTYRITEKTAPKGYLLNDGFTEFKVSETGFVSGNTTLYNEKEGKKVGRITAFYKKNSDSNGKKNRHGNGFDDFGKRIRLPKMGDVMNPFSILGGLLSIFVLIYLFKKKKQNKTK